MSRFIVVLEIYFPQVGLGKVGSRIKGKATKFDVNLPLPL
jgi:hypothetical protein